MADKIFVNYRRDDVPGDARGVRDGLAAKFGKAYIFMDVDNLLVGQRFDVQLDEALDSCDVLVAVIGPRWMEVLRQRVASGERDYVREEIAAALKRRIVVIPVRVGREGSMPALPRAEELPDDIRDLVLQQKIDVAHERFGRDVAELINGIVTARRMRSRGEQPSPLRRVPWGWMGTSALVAVIAAYAGAYLLEMQVPWPGVITRGGPSEFGKSAAHEKRVGEPSGVSAGCADPEWAETERVNTRAAFEGYWEKTSRKCADAARLAVRDVREWERIEASVPSDMAGEGSFATPVEPALAELRKSILQYQNEFGPKRRRQQEASALLAKVDQAIKASMCRAYVKEAMTYAAENAREGCGERGEEWDPSADIQRDLCMRREAETVVSGLKQRAETIGRCKRNKIDEEDWRKAYARKGAAPGSKEMADYISALRDYVKRYAQGGLHLGNAQQVLRLAEQAELEQVCEAFAAEAVKLALTNQQTACQLDGPAWAVAHRDHRTWCLGRPESDSAREIKTRREQMETCTLRTRTDEAWREASESRSIEKIGRYIAEWSTGPHTGSAATLLEELCAPRWQAAQKGEWRALELFAHKGCRFTKRKAEAEPLIEALDRRVWQQALAGKSKASFQKYLVDTGEVDCNLAEEFGPGGVNRCWKSTGRHADQARKEIRDFDAWTEANKPNGTCADVGSYLRDWPEGRFKQLARAKLAQMIKNSSRRTGGEAVARKGLRIEKPIVDQSEEARSTDGIRRRIKEPLDLSGATPRDTPSRDDIRKRIKEPMDLSGMTPRDKASWDDCEQYEDLLNNSAGRTMPPPVPGGAERSGETLPPPVPGLSEEELARVRLRPKKSPEPRRLRGVIREDGG